MTQPVSSSDTSPKTLSEERVIAAARKLFMERGFSSVSGDLLCREARVSKTSLYKYFGDMNGVLEAVLVDEGDTYQLDINTEPATEAAFWRTLTDYGENLLRLLNEPFCLNMDRMIHEEARSNPSLIQLFYENAYGRGHRSITALLKHGQKQGFIKPGASAEDLADNLISMWEGLRFIRARLSLTDMPFEDPSGWSKQCVNTLFNRERP